MCKYRSKNGVIPVSSTGMTEKASYWDDTIYFYGCLFYLILSPC
ncbi:MAG: hypothetical protein ACEY3L_11920 [Wolbachia sp.]